MSNISFTPGPWKWWTSNSWRRLTAHDAAGRYEQEGNVLCPIVCRDGHPDVTISIADMALIAAAPDMYDALDDLLDYSGGAENALEDPYVVERAKAALAAARGEVAA